MKKTAFILAGLAALIALILSCGGQLELRPVGGWPKELSTAAAAKKTGVAGESQVVFRFFEEDFTPGGFEYVYPEKSKVFINERREHVKNGEASLQFDLIPDDYSGGAVCLYNMMYDLTPYLETGGALQFWIKGMNGGEIAYAALADDETNNGKKTVVRLPINKYGGIKKDDWTQISIPLVDFGERGMWWDPKTRQESPEMFQWDKVKEFRLQIDKGVNKEFTVWIDDIFVVSNVFEPKALEKMEYWDAIEETVDDVPVATKPEGIKEIAKVTNQGNPVTGGFAYVYGGRTAYKVQKTKSGGTAFAMYQDGNEWSGVTISIGENKYIDLTSARTAPAAGLAFWAKGAPNVNAIRLGILDNQGNEIKVQTVQLLADFGSIDTEWKYFMIPIRRFNEQGRFWDAMKQTEIMGMVDWSKIQEIRFAVGKLENRVPANEPVAFYVSDVAFIEAIPGYVDPDDYWNAFQSNAPEIMLHDFETEIDQKWNVSHDDKSEGSFKFVESTAPNGGKYALEVTYRLRSWVDVLYSYAENNRPAEHRDWTKHWGLKFDFWTDRPYQPIIVQVQDKGNEIFTASTGGNRGWTEIIVPFRNFTKFPHYQPPEAIQTGTFDLDGVHVLDFKPAGEGSRGTFRVDNVRLTNDRVAKVKEVPAKVDVKIEGSLDKDKVITQKINPGIFGINVALWDGDLQLPETKKYVKAVNHQVLRYPGGLRADEDDWEEILKAKDWMIDTDQFFDYLKETGTEGMITVNFGSGTPEKAARWVAHAKAKNANVKLWEIGNELYGSWHVFHCTPEEYGKRGREFAIQMKKADPNAIITAVWSLEGDWNRIVFEHMKDVVDGVNVHHYPQAAGQENDAGLLSAPQDLPAILGSVRKQLEDYGVKGKKYEIWLTEWNSVDFRPGPQTMTIVNALFVADYLGMLSHVNIEQASYWDVHNDITPEGGDYGYLSRTGSPDGDNVPRASYWAFKMASHSLGRGSVFKSGTGDDNVTSYLTQDGNRKSLMIVNKYPRTVADATINIPGFEGKAKMQQLTPENSGSPGIKGPGPNESSIDVKPGMKMSLPAYSVTTITIE
jgi:hypothetical protein